MMAKKKKSKDAEAMVALGGLHAPVVAIALTNEQINSDGHRGVILALSIEEEKNDLTRGKTPWYVHAMDADGARTVAQTLMQHAAMAEGSEPIPGVAAVAAPPAGPTPYL